MTSKYTLLFDGNFFLNKVFAVAQKIKFTSSKKVLNFIDEPDDDKNILLWKLALDFSAEIKRFADISDSIIYTVDSGSWRKTVFPEQNYKGHRKKSDTVDWSGVFKTHDEFIIALEKCGIIISKVSKCEGDDLLFAWSKTLNQQGRNTIIISGDNDLLQLANIENECNSIFFNKFDKNLHTFRGFKKWLDTSDSDFVDIFALATTSSTVKDDFKKIIKTSKMGIDEINVNEYIFKKILTGDAGDNVSPLYTKIKTSKTGKDSTFGVTDRHVGLIMDKYKTEHPFISESHFFNDDNIKYICEIAKEVIKIEDTDLDLTIKYKINRDMVFLHGKCIPIDIMDAMHKHIESFKNTKLSGSKFNEIQLKDNILVHSSYDATTVNEINDSSVFKKMAPKNIQPIVKIQEEPTDSGFDAGFWNNLIN